LFRASAYVVFAWRVQPRAMLFVSVRHGPLPAQAVSAAPRAFTHCVTDSFRSWFAQKAHVFFA